MFCMPLERDKGSNMRMSTTETMHKLDALLVNTIKYNIKSYTKIKWHHKPKDLTGKIVPRIKMQRISALLYILVQILPPMGGLTLSWG